MAADATLVPLYIQATNHPMELALTDLLGDLVIEGQYRSHRFSDRLEQDGSELKKLVSHVSAADLGETLPPSSKVPGWTGWGALILKEWLTLSREGSKSGDLISIWLREHPEHPGLLRPMLQSHWNLPMAWGEGLITTHGLWALASLTHTFNSLACERIGRTTPRSPIAHTPWIVEDLSAMMASADTLLDDVHSPGSLCVTLAQTLASLILDTATLSWDSAFIKQRDLMIHAWEAQPIGDRFAQLTQWCRHLVIGPDPATGLIPQLGLGHKEGCRWFDRWAHVVCEAQAAGVHASSSQVQIHLKLLEDTVGLAIETHTHTGVTSASETDLVVLPVLRALREFQPALVNPQVWCKAYARVPVVGDNPVVGELSAWAGEVTARLRAEKAAADQKFPILGRLRSRP